MYNNNFKMICIPIFSSCKRHWNNNCGGNFNNNWNSYDFYGTINYRNNRQNNYISYNQNNGCGCGSYYPETWNNYSYNQFNDFMN